MMFTPSPIMLFMTYTKTMKEESGSEAISEE